MADMIFVCSAVHLRSYEQLDEVLFRLIFLIDRRISLKLDHIKIEFITCLDYYRKENYITGKMAILETHNMTPMKKFNSNLS